MSTPARVAAVADLGETVVESIADVIGTGTDLAREVADELIHSAAGVLGSGRRRRRSAPIGKLLAVVLTMAAGAVLFSVLRRRRASRTPTIEVATDQGIPTSSNGSRDPVAAPVS